tara:strand:+ start:402 stop:764 length:363 start_codon:yes stop_codon:yes gene_type:complete
MKISKQKLKQIILEEFESMEEITASAASDVVDDEADSTKVKSGVKAAGTFAQDRKIDALNVNPEISNTERSILAQIDKFLLDLAAIEGVELNNNRPQIEQILKLFKTRIAKKAPKQGEQK